MKVRYLLQMWPEKADANLRPRRLASVFSGYLRSLVIDLLPCSHTRYAVHLLDIKGESRALKYLRKSKWDN